MRAPTVLTLSAAALIVLTMSAAPGIPGAAAAEPAGMSAAPAPTLGDVNRVEELQALLARDRGKYRIVLLLSPT